MLTQVRPGTYTLFAKPQPGKPNEPTETVATYYPSTTDRTQAAPVVMRGGDDLPGFDIRLRTSPVYRICGVVLPENGKPLKSATVKLLSKSTDTTLSGQMAFGTRPGVCAITSARPGCKRRRRWRFRRGRHIRISVGAAGELAIAGRSRAQARRPPEFDAGLERQYSRRGDGPRPG